MIEIKLYRRPNQHVIDEVIEIIRLLQTDWFTEDVPEDTRKDLMFQDLICVKVKGRIKSFLVFTSWEGSIYITLMGTHPENRGQGLGSKLINYLIRHVTEIGFKRVSLLTVPPEVKPLYEHTVKFYEKHGFIVSKRYSEIWGSGAIEMSKNL